ncbi:MAG: DUF2520 domain-containing protein [Bacteroidetes bacterium]|nr:DUF2520 domain-containing protein [Bacteroidota bacterium]
MQSIEKIVIIGAGSLATNLAIALKNSKLKIVQIVNRTLSNAALLASKVEASYTNDFNAIDLQADLYIISVSDTSISGVLEKLHLNEKLVVHTAGTIDLQILKSISQNYGVFYPLQTFSKEEIVTFNNIPICIEANSVENESLLIQLGMRMSNNIQKINSEQRKILHISAVFASNFSSYMYLLANEILSDNQISFDILKPLIHRTAEKIQTHQPKDALTGPARRNDTSVLEAHLNILKEHPDYQEIYKLISKNIVKHFYQS